MSFQILSERLATLQESNKRLQELIDRLRSINFQPGSIPLENEGDNVISELSAEIQQTIRAQDEDFELLQEEASALDSGRPGCELEEQKAGLEQVIGRAIAELRKLQKDFRKAQIIAKRNSEAAQRAERELLLQSYADPHSNLSSPISTQRRTTSRAPKDLTQDENAINASSDVTLALRRTHDMMTAELSRSQFAHDTLKESTAALARLGETYSRLDTMLSSSRNLLSTLISSQKSDTWYLETAFMILAITIGWLVFRRLIYGPAWWLIWLPIKILYKSLVGVVSAIGLLGGTGVAVSNGTVNDLPSQISGTWVSMSSAAGSQASVVMGDGGTGTFQPGASTYSAIEDVGKIIDESNKPSQEGEQNTEDSSGEGSKPEPEHGQKDASIEQQAGSQRNPKKRIWEEKVGANDGKKDEL